MQKKLYKKRLSIILQSFSIFSLKKTKNRIIKLEN